MDNILLLLQQVCVAEMISVIFCNTQIHCVWHSQHSWWGVVPIVLQSLLWESMGEQESGWERCGLLHVMDSVDGWCPKSVQLRPGWLLLKLVSQNIGIK